MRATTRIPVLMYHRVGDAHNDWERKYCVSPDRFSAHMHALRDDGFSAITLAQFFDWLRGAAELPEKSLLVTFDDGFLGVYEYAAPVLDALDWPATVFLVSGLIGQRDAWCEKHNPSGATYPLMNAEQLHALMAQGFRFESHTRSHADLPTLDDVALADELRGARSDLEQMLGHPVRYLAYPFGRHDARVIEAAQTAGYEAAFSTQPGFNRQDVDRFRLRRMDVFGTDSATALLRKIELGSNDGSLLNKTTYYVKRVLSRAGMGNR